MTQEHLTTFPLTRENHAMTDYKILVVEDDAPVLDLLVSILESEGFQVVSARNGQDALTLLHSFNPDVILSDIMMPVMNGLEFLKHVQSDEKTRNIPFLFLSAKKDVQDKVEGLSIGADDYICKPFVLEELLARIRTRLKKKEELLARSSLTRGAMVGDLTVFPIIDLVQILRLEKKTGEMTLSFQNTEAYLRLNQGEVVDVEFGQLSGVQAFLSILEHEQGWFSFSLADGPFPTKLELNTQELLVESTRQLDEYKNLLAKLPPLELVYRISERKSSTVLSVKEMKILYLFDGEHNLGEVFQNSPFEQSKTVEIMQDLIHNGFLEENVPGQPPLDHEPSFGLTALDQESMTRLRSILKSHQGIPCIMVISLDLASVEQFLYRLCSPDQLIKNDYSLNRKEKINFQKVAFDDRDELNIYGLKGFRQFSFLWHVLDRDILGLILLIETTKTLDQPSIQAFYELLNRTYELPYITALNQTGASTDTNPEPMPHQADHDYHLFPCSFASGHSLAILLKKWLEFVTEHRPIVPNKKNG
ncbi:response regulator [bacterium]|nr:response regulator [bacterium]